MNKLLRNIIYSLTGNLFSMVISIGIVLIVPKILTLENYGLWQLFIFYYSYVGFLHFGWEDGIYIRYAGIRYNLLNRELIFNQIIAIVFGELIIGSIISLYAYFFIFDDSYSQLFQLFGFVVLLANSNNMFNLIFQMTGRIKDYAQMTAGEPIVFVFVVALCFTMGYCSYVSMVVSKIIALIAIVVFSILKLGDLFSEKLCKFADIVNEARKNIIVGSKLMAANIASMLMLGIVRFGISQGWDIVVFGKISLTLSISNFLLVFINAVSVVLLPVLKNVASDKMNIIYQTSRIILTFSMLSLLLAYYPLYAALAYWLPQYSDSLTYMAVLFPICMYESRMSLMINTYLKAMRKEKQILIVNVISVVFSLLVTGTTVYVIHDLSICVCSIVVLFAFRCCCAEQLLTHELGLNVKKSMLEENIMIVLFIFFSWYLDGIIGFSGYVIILILYAVFHWKEIKNSWILIHGMTNTK